VLFWSLPFVLALGQALVMWRLVDRIAYEEMSESCGIPTGWPSDPVRPCSTNVSWYAFLLGLYKIFGFHLHSPMGSAWPARPVHDSAAWLLKRLLG